MFIVVHLFVQNNRYVAKQKNDNKKDHGYEKPSIEPKHPYRCYHRRARKPLTANPPAGK
jgi:hypothetical protein